MRPESTRWTATLLGLLMMAACGRSQGPATPTPAPFDPVGNYTARTDFQGQSVTLRISISGTPGSWTGLLSTDADLPSVPLTTVTVDGNTVTARGNAMGQILEVTMVFTGDDFTGTWNVAGVSGAMTGRRNST